MDKRSVKLTALPLSSLEPIQSSWIYRSRITFKPMRCLDNRLKVQMSIFDIQLIIYPCTAGDVQTMSR